MGEKVQAIFDAVVAIVTEETGVPPEEILLVTRLDALVEDSLELTELIFVIREALGPLPEHVDTISDVVYWYFGKAS